jgi:hypothetical protein
MDKLLSPANGETTNMVSPQHVSQNRVLQDYDAHGCASDANAGGIRAANAGNQDAGDNHFHRGGNAPNIGVAKYPVSRVFAE